MNYNESTRQRIADMILGLHVRTTHAGLGTSVFTNAAQTELFTVVGRIGIKQLFIELTATADANATTMAFNCTFTTPTIAVNEMQADCGSIANLTAGTRITFVGGAVATALVLTDSAGLTDVEAAGKMHIIGGETSAGANYAGTIGCLGAAATQAGTITATAHLYYVPMSPGAYAEALI
jgi:hypothetical protein